MAVETLRPNANGETVDLRASPGAGYNYEEVDEESPDGNSTYVFQGAEIGEPEKDIYQLGNSAVGAGTITKVTVKIVAKWVEPE